MQYRGGLFNGFRIHCKNNMLSPTDTIKQYAIKPRKRLGQSFLIEEDIIKKIVFLANVTEKDIVIEIGSGIGVMTEYLAQTSSAKIIAVELDSQLIKVLKDRLASYHNVEIINKDIMHFDFYRITQSENQKIKIIGNIPYNISSPLLFKLLSLRKIIDSFILMMQKEVVQRLVARHGGKEYGVTSVIFQMFARIEKLFDVPPYYFYPRPKVESSVIRGVFLDKPVVDITDEDFFMKLIRDSFAQRRKMLINNLKKSKLLCGVSESLIREVLVSAKVDGQRRGETLDVNEYGHISNMLSLELKKFKD